MNKVWRVDLLWTYSPIKYRSALKESILLPLILVPIGEVTLITGSHFCVPKLSLSEKQQPKHNQFLTYSPNKIPRILDLIICLNLPAKFAKIIIIIIKRRTSTATTIMVRDLHFILWPRSGSCCNVV